MHHFLEHIFRKKAPRAGEDNRKPTLDLSRGDSVSATCPPLDLKIHHDLDALVQEPLLSSGASHPAHAATKPEHSHHWISSDSSRSFIPLRPNYRRPPPSEITLPQRLDDAATQTTVNTELPISKESQKRPVPTAEVSFTTSTASSNSKDTSVGTFGTRPPWRIKECTDDRRTPQTPTTDEGHTKRRLRSLSSHSKAGTPSYESMSKRSQQSSMSSTSRDTFGKSSPNRNPTNVRQPRRFSDAAPPLPPLSHPAFSAAGTVALRDSPPKEDQPTLTRNSHSSPTLQKFVNSKAGVPRSRTRTSSSSRSTSLAAAARILAESPKLSSPTGNLAGSEHRRSQSSGSRRRASSESRFNRATSLQDVKGTADWEAEVSKAIVRLSLESCHGRGNQGASPSRKGNARGDRAQRTRSLGSPFFLSDAHSYYPPVTLTNNLTARYNLARPPKDQGVKESKPMSQVKSGPSHSSRTANASARSSRTPSPPTKNSSTPRRTSPLASTSHLVPPSVQITGPTPDTSPIFPEVSQQPPDAEATKTHGTTPLNPPTTPPPLRTPTTSMSKGKRKAEEVEGDRTPPKEGKEPHTTFAADPRPNRPSGNSSYAPSSYHNRKRARLAPTPDSSRPGSRPDSRASADVQTTKTTGSHNSKTSHQQPPRSVTPGQQPPRTSSRRSMRSLSQASIPLSALISPHAPSLTPSGVFHMRDPRRPAPVQSTPWSLSLPSGQAERNEGWRGWVERGGSPLHAWLFFVGFVVFPLLWLASFLSIPRTRQIGGGAAEKGVTLDDPQLEYDSYSWRKRCRIMAGVSLVTYIPFIVLVAVFASR